MENGNGEAAEEEEEEKAFWWLGERNDAVVVRRRRGISARVSVLTIAAPSGGSNRRLPNRPTLPLILPSLSLRSLSVSLFELPCPKTPLLLLSSLVPNDTV